MRIGLSRRAPKAFTLVVALAAFGGVAYAQDSELSRKLKEGVDLLERGQTQAANAKFREVLAADPSNEDAYQLVRETDFRVFLEMMKARGEAEQAALRLLTLARVEELEKSRDEEAISGLVDTSVQSRDLLERERAARQLAAEHGEYAVPRLLSFLGSNDPDVRANAILALNRIGTDAVLPLAASLEAGGDIQRHNVANLLGRLGDVRAVPALIRAAVGDGLVASAARESLARLGVRGGSASDAYVALAAEYFKGDPDVVRNFDRSYTVWSVADGQLVARDVPRFLYNFELAEEAAYDALEIKPDHRDAQAMVALVNFAEQAAFENLSEEARRDETIMNAGQTLAGASAVGMAVGTGDLLRAFDLAASLGNPDAALRIADALPQVWDGRPIGGENPLVAHLTHPHKGIRYASAIALLRINPDGPFPKSNMVAQIAGQAAAERAVKQVLVIDTNSKNAMNAQRALNDAGFHAVAFTDSARALLAAKATGGFDAVVVSHRLSDLTTFQVLDELRRDFRTSGAKLVVMAPGAELGQAQTDFERREIAAVAPLGTDDAQGVVNVLRDVLKDEEGDAGRVRANALSVKAADALRGAANGPFLMKDAVPGLLDAAAEGADEAVRLAALKALSEVATPEAADPLRSVLARTENSAAVRVAAAEALGRALQGRTPSPETFQALLDAMGEGDVDLARAAGAALGRAKLTAEQQVEVVQKRRVN